jgi:hypothetical protein
VVQHRELLDPHGRHAPWKNRFTVNRIRPDGNCLAG